MSDTNVRAFNMLKTLSHFGSTALALNAMRNSEPGASEAFLHSLTDLSIWAFERLRRGYKQRAGSPTPELGDEETATDNTAEEFIKKINSGLSFICNEIKWVISIADSSSNDNYEFNVNIVNNSNYTGKIELLKSTVKKSVERNQEFLLFIKYIFGSGIKLTNSENNEEYELNVKEIDTTLFSFYVNQNQGPEITICMVESFKLQQEF